jgi:uncharacterized protein
VSEPGTGRLVGWATLVGCVSAVGFVGRFSGSKPEKDALYHYSTAVGELALFAVIFGVVLAIASGLPKRELFALRPPTSWRRAAGIALGVLIGVLVVSWLLNPLLHASKEQGLTPAHWEPSHAAEFAANFATFALVGPIVEELTFRGMGFRLLERFGRTAAILFVGLAFGLWHGLVDALPILTAFGIGLAYLRSRTASVYPGILLHATFNSLALVVAVST